MPMCMSMSPKGKYLAVMLKDKIIRIFNLLTGKNIDSLNESIK